MSRRGRCTQSFRVCGCSESAVNLAQAQERRNSILGERTRKSGNSQCTLGRVGRRRNGSPASTEGLLRNNWVGQLLGVGGEGELFVIHVAQSP